jgi:Flp pilus assembly protein TadG
VPFLLLLLMIVVDAARAFDALIVLTNAVREGARYASLEPRPIVYDIEGLVVDDVVGSGTNITHMEDFSAANVTIIDDPTQVVLTVTASYEFPLWFGGLVGLDSVTLEKSATMPTAEIEDR